MSLGDRLFDDVSSQIRITNKYRSNEALRLILINLSRDKAFRQPEHEGTLRQVMTEAYQKILGKDFLPVITNK